MAVQFAGNIASIDRGFFSKPCLMITGGYTRQKGQLSGAKYGFQIASLAEKMLIVKRIHTKQGIYRLICVLEQKYRGFQPTELNSWLHSHVHYLYTSTYNNNIYNHIYIYICYKNLRMLYIYCRLLIFSYPKQSPGDHHGPGRSLGGWAMLLALLQGGPSGIPDPQKTTVDTKSCWK